MKKNIWKRLLSLALALVLVAGWMPHMATEAHAADTITGTTPVEYPGNNIRFSIFANCYECDSDRIYLNANDGKHEISFTHFEYKITGNSVYLYWTATFKSCTGKTGTRGMSNPKTYSFDCETNERIGYHGVSMGSGSFFGGVNINIFHDFQEHIGDATCNTNAPCTRCGTSYRNASNHEKPNEFIYSVNSSNKDNHDVKYACCNVVKETVAHTAEPTYTVSTSDHTKHDKTYACCDGIAQTAVHSTTYSKTSENVVTESCTQNCGHSATATLTTENKTYTGSAIICASFAYSEGWLGNKDLTDGNIVNLTKTDAGTYTASITVEGQNLTKEFTIAPYDISGDKVTVEFNPADSIYTGQAQKPSYIVKFNGETMEEDTSYTATWGVGEFTNAGDYQLVVTGKDGSNFTGTKSATYTIGKADPTANLFLMTPPNNTVYDGTTAYSAEVSTSAYGMGEFTVKYNGSEEAPINAGTYTVTVDVAEGDNYNAVTNLTVGSFAVAPADGSATLSVADVEYGDSVIPVPTSSTNGTDNVTYQYKAKGADDSTYTSEVPKLPGDYTVKANFPATTNYKATEATADFTISKRAVTATVTAQNKTYDGTTDAVITATVEDVVYGDTFEISGLTGAFSDANAGEGKTVTVDSSNASVTGTNVEYYVVSFPATATATIAKAAAPTITFPEVLNAITYGQKLEEAKLSFYTNDYGTFNWNASTSFPNAGIAGYALDFYPNELALQNYDWKNVGDAQWIETRNALCICPNVTVNKAASTITTAPTANTLTYNEEDQTLIAAGSTGDGTMVYSLEKEGEYTAELPEAKTAGTYHVWYKVIGDGNHNDSAPASVEVKIDKADPGIGAVTAGVVENTLDSGAIVLTQENTDIPGTLAVDAEQTLAVGENTIRYTFTPNDTTNYKVVKDEVAVTVVDTVAPTGTVTVSTKSWAEFLNNITFGLFFKETQTVSVTASDNLSDTAKIKIEYIESKTAMDLDAVKAATQWTEMEGGSVSVTREDTKQFVYYIRITDKSGNIAYLSSDGAEYDTTAPVIEGVNTGVTYYTTQAVTVTDKNIDTITLNGEAATGSITLEGNKEATYTIVATDKAGNSTTITVTMKPIKALAEATENLGNDNVTSADAPALEALVEKLDELLADEDVSENGEKETLEQHKTIAESLLQTIEENAAEQKAVTDKAAEYDKNAVKSTDKAGLEELAEDVDALLDTNNLTQDERAALEALLEDVEDMIDTINTTAADSKTATDAVDSCDIATVTSKDKAAIESALEIIEDLLDTKHLTDTERDALEDAKADAEALLEIIEEAAKAADTDNTAKVEDVTTNNVTPNDKSDLEKAKTDLEDALTDNGGNYTEEEKKAIKDEIQRIEDALEIVGNVEAAEDVISKLPATVEPDDEETVAKIEEAKKAYEELTDYEKSLVDKKVEEKLDKLTAAAVDYKIVKGDSGKWSKDTTSGLSFTANGSFAKFVSVEVDGKVINAKHYSVKSGSTIVTLNASYLETLSVGTHAITVVYTDGEAEGTFKVKAKSANPATGDDFNILLWTSVMIVSLAAIAALLIEHKKRRYVK